MVVVVIVDTNIIKSDFDKSNEFNGSQYASKRVTAILIHLHLFILDGIGHLPLCILDI